jgi:hypothetical protein
MIRAIVSMAILLSSTVFVHAQTECTRSMLKVAADSYIEAQKTGSLSKMSLDPKVKFMENMSDTTKEKGLWNTALPIALNHSIYDVPRCKTFSEIIVTQGKPYVIGTRLTVKDGKVTEIDSLVTKEGDWLFNPGNYLKYSSADDWSVQPLDTRASRQDLVDAGNQYFDLVFLDSHIQPPWGTPCARLEGGAYTNEKNEYKDTCKVEGAIQGGGMYIVNRSFIVDEEMQMVNVYCRFGNNTGMPDSHLFRLVNGRYRWIHTLSVNLTGKPVVIPKAPPEGK